MDSTPEHDGHDPRRGHEPTEIDPRPIFYFVGGLITTIVVVQLLVTGQLGWYSGRQTPAVAKISPLPPLKNQPSREPRLQEAYAIDLAVMRRREQEELGSSGWVDEKARTVRIPIDEAMRVIANEGLPTRKPLEAADAAAKPKNSDAR